MERIHRWKYITLNGMLECKCCGFVSILFRIKWQCYTVTITQAISTERVIHHSGKLTPQKKLIVLNVCLAGWLHGRAALCQSSVRVNGETLGGCLVNQQYTVLSQIWLRHRSCRHEFEVPYSNTRKVFLFRDFSFHVVDQPIAHYFLCLSILI